MNVCRLVQVLISLTAARTTDAPEPARRGAGVPSGSPVAGAPLSTGRPAWLVRRLHVHLEHCETCRESIRRDETLARQLWAQAPGACRPIPPFLAGRIATRLAATPDAPSRISWRPAGALAATAALLLAVFWLWPTPRLASNMAGASGIEPSFERALTHADLPLPDVGRLLAYSQGLDHALEREWQLVVADARKAAASLAAEFLPQPGGAGEGRAL